MPGASDQTRRVDVVNANWRAGEPGADGAFELLLVTEDGERHTVSPSPAAMSALVALTQAGTVLLWDPEARVLIGANVVGEWLPTDWSAQRRIGRPSPGRTDRPSPVALIGPSPSPTAPRLDLTARSGQTSRGPTSHPTDPRRLPSVSQQPFEAIVAEHGSTVLRVCRAVLGPELADDAWSETFLSALRAYPDLPPGSNVQAWLVTIAHRKAIDQLRTQARRPRPAAELPEQPSRVGVPGSWESDLWAALGQLPTKQRQTVAYHHLAGLPYAEVAAIVGGTPSAARRAAADGIAALRTSYLNGAMT